MALTGSKILGHAGSYKTREVHVPAWADESGDDVVIVRGMTLMELELNQGRASDGKATASVLARCVLNPDGSRAFTDADVHTLSQLQLGECGPLNVAIMELSGLGGDGDVEAAVESAGKDSPPTTGDGSSSG